jgi:hypothetical protein
MPATMLVSCARPRVVIIIQYQNDSPVPKFFDYRCILYAYSNFSTNQDTYYVARLNDVVKVMYYKDA